MISSSFMSDAVSQNTLDQRTSQPCKCMSKQKPIAKNIIV